MNERALTIGAAPRLLEARLAASSAAPRGGVVVCHPHPEYGGDMGNAVVLAGVRGALEAGWSALRFNFGGVGASQGRYGGGSEEVGDVLAAVAALRGALPADAALAIIGYSFGAWVGARAVRHSGDVRHMIAIAPPLRVFDWGFASSLGVPFVVVAGDRDAFCPRDRLDTLLAATGWQLAPIAGADHFLAGREEEVAAAIRNRL